MNLQNEQVDAELSERINAFTKRSTSQAKVYRALVDLYDKSTTGKREQFCNLFPITLEEPPKGSLRTKKHPDSPLKKSLGRLARAMVNCARTDQISSANGSAFCILEFAAPKGKTEDAVHDWLRCFVTRLTSLRCYAACVPVQKVNDMCEHANTFRANNQRAAQIQIGKVLAESATIISRSGKADKDLQITKNANLTLSNLIEYDEKIILGDARLKKFAREEMLIACYSAAKSEECGIRAIGPWPVKYPGSRQEQSLRIDFSEFPKFPPDASAAIAPCRHFFIYYQVAKAMTKEEKSRIFGGRNENCADRRGQKNRV